MGRKSVPLTEKQLFEKIENNSEIIPFSGCWIWTKTTNGTGKYGRGGYGIISTCNKGEHKYVHRLMYELFYGPIPNGKMICHRCDVKCCVNPHHLFLSDAKGNAQDRDSKGRGNNPGAPGEKNRKARLIEKDIRIIRFAHKLGHSTKAIASQFEITESYAWRVWSGRAWKHIQ